mmetsp:Transcript_13456/g.22068  ORF Transcript_13456/g.22068 Transcript_13456/m.22068 type:complete len:188 (-) Transcript_13456:1232-1795(-)|eukprot:CAMPEP_0184657164 /NCGR_PEP_ID=MMETSP0308-20130426/17023_1 /TAXON_ID=38269 /ORGANISM="Gloeochaete witrockiana, Strain SAG 46.84" /LENGTH=187 /DNA_ID=CAMNT_0027094601 /DNA_START=142 /DNA_END=705 /DNA_ORIENTATION=-
MRSILLNEAAAQKKRLEGVHKKVRFNIQEDEEEIQNSIQHNPLYKILVWWSSTSRTTSGSHDPQNDMRLHLHAVAGLLGLSESGQQFNPPILAETCRAFDKEPPKPVTEEGATRFSKKRIFEISPSEARVDRIRRRPCVSEPDSLTITAAEQRRIRVQRFLQKRRRVRMGVRPDIRHHPYASAVKVH